MTIGEPLHDVGGGLSLHAFGHLTSRACFKRMAIVVVLYCLLGVVQSQSEGAAAVKSDFQSQVRVVTFEFPPHISSDEQGRLAGPAIDVAGDLLRQAGLQPQFVAMPWNRALRSVESGESDLILPFFHTPERAKLYAYMDLPFVEFRLVLFAIANRHFEFDGDLTRLKGMRVSRIRNVSTTDHFDRLVEQGLIDLVDAESTRQQMLQLINGRADLAVGVEGTQQAALMTLNRSGEVTPLRPALEVRQAYIAAAQTGRGRALIRQLNRAMRASQPSKND